MREQSIKLIEIVLAKVFEKIYQIPIPNENTSEIQKIQIKVISHFLTMISNALKFGDYSCWVVISPKNIIFLEQFMDFLCKFYENGLNKNKKECTLAILMIMLARLNGVELQNLKSLGSSKF